MPQAPKAPLIRPPRPPLPALLQDRLQRCAQRCQDKAQEGLSATPSQKEIDKAQKQLANCLADCAQVGGCGWAAGHFQSEDRAVAGLCSTQHKVQYSRT